jgi:hypothetical protein
MRYWVNDKALKLQRILPANWANVIAGEMACGES